MSQAVAAALEERRTRVAVVHPEVAVSQAVAAALEERRTRVAAGRLVAED